MRLIVGISGASGAVYGVELLRVLKSKSVETDLVLTHAARTVIENEIDMTAGDVTSLATRSHNVDDLTAPIASGGHDADGMVVIPCSMKSMAAIAHGYASNLLLRAADVTLKERKTLVLVPRETPLNVIQIGNMLSLAKAGAVILPAMPAWYHDPREIRDLVNHVVGKVLDIFRIDHSL